VDTLSFILTKVVPKIVKSPDWISFPPLLDQIVSQISLIDIFLTLRQAITTDQEACLVKDSRSQELVLRLFRKSFVADSDWPATIFEQAQAIKIDTQEIVEMLFRFRTLLINFLEACPLELIDSTFFTGMFDSLATYLPVAD